MARTLAAALAYVGLVFAMGFALGTLRVLVVIPRIGELRAVLVELPLIIAASWFASAWICDRFKVSPGLADRLQMGAVAFGVLMAAELAFGIALFGRSVEAQIAAYATLPAQLGLAGQIAFALIPAAQGRRAAA